MTSRHTAAGTDDAGAGVTDPVCGMSIEPGSEADRSDYAGTTYLFCSTGCANKFRQEPTRFLRPQVTATNIHSDSIYTCPMHPDIRQVGPGDCPKCGMSLEPVDATAEQDDSELRDMSRRFWIAVLLTAPLLVAVMGNMLFDNGLAGIIGHTTSQWIELALATPVVLWCAWPFFVRGARSVKSLSPNMWTLISIGVSIAYVYSVVATVAPGLFPESFRGEGGRVGVYFEAAAVIVTLVLLGQVMELRARRQTGGAIRELLELAPPTARLLGDNGAEEEVPVDVLNPGDRIRVRPGDKIPIDGEVIDGRSTIDESMLTGEPVPGEKHPGAEVTGGPVNKAGSFVMAVSRIGADTTLSQIVQMVADAQRSRAPIQRLADAVAAGSFQRYSRSPSSRLQYGHLSDRSRRSRTP